LEELEVGKKKFRKIKTTLEIL